MRKVLAVSGGIDSMVMLDFLCRNYPDNYLVVTIDHGIREGSSSADDATFVARIAETRYHLPVQTVHLHLGETTSEAAARQARYNTLFHIAGTDGEIYLAHHLDDLCESIAINLLRGTGWRGLAVMNRQPIPNPDTHSLSSEPRLIRPFLTLAFCGTHPIDKSWIYHYAADHNIIFREDPTNSEDTYLRNRLRPTIRTLPGSTKAKLYTLWQSQLTLEKDIAAILSTLPTTLSRSWLTSLDDPTLDEILRHLLLTANIPTTRPERRNLVHALRTYKDGKSFNLPNDILLKMGKIISFCSSSTDSKI